MEHTHYVDPAEPRVPRTRTTDDLLRAQEAVTKRLHRVRTLHHLPPAQIFAPSQATHWDKLLEEMRWMANDFHEERKWKKHAASILAANAAARGAEVHHTVSTPPESGAKSQARSAEVMAAVSANSKSSSEDEVREGTNSASPVNTSVANKITETAAVGTTRPSVLPLPSTCDPSGDGSQINTPTSKSPCDRIVPLSASQAIVMPNVPAFCSDQLVEHVAAPAGLTHDNHGAKTTAQLAQAVTKIGLELKRLMSAAAHTLPAGERYCLLPFQVQALHWLSAAFSRQCPAVFADVRGLGKCFVTLQFLVRATFSDTHRQFVIVVPSYRISKWRALISKHYSMVDATFVTDAATMHEAAVSAVLPHQADNFDLERHSHSAEMAATQSRITIVAAHLLQCDGTPRRSRRKGKGPSRATSSSSSSSSSDETTASPLSPLQHQLCTKIWDGIIVDEIEGLDLQTPAIRALVIASKWRLFLSSAPCPAAGQRRRLAELLLTPTFPYGVARPTIVTNPKALPETALKALLKAVTLQRTWSGIDLDDTTARAVEPRSLKFSLEPNQCHAYNLIARRSTIELQKLLDARNAASAKFNQPEAKRVEKSGSRTGKSKRSKGSAKSGVDARNRSNSARCAPMNAVLRVLRHHVLIPGV